MSETACPKCNGKTHVTHVYAVGRNKVRRRQCSSCRITFHTRQRIAAEKRTKFARSS